MEKIRREHEKKHGNKYVIEFTDYTVKYKGVDARDVYTVKD